MIQGIDDDPSGESNWVSTYYLDSYGKDWIQAGWRYYYGYNTPRQYAEYCLNCNDGVGDHLLEEYGNHSWGATIEYFVDRAPGSEIWCAYANGVQRLCQGGYYTYPATVMAQSEIHRNSLNPLDTWFYNVMYKDPYNSDWGYFNWDGYWRNSDYPYDVAANWNYEFHTYRHATNEAYLPLLIK